MEPDSKSAIALAHLRLPVTDLATAIRFFEALGGSADVRQDKFAVVALQDRTRIQLTVTEAGAAAGPDLQFDFRVGDIDAAWRDYDAKGLNPAAITRQNPGHDFFILLGPDGSEVKINGGYKSG
jgi:catechol 2,3-dioxygenase-like lactoylglutathione lyase family enzyme